MPAQRRTALFEEHVALGADMGSYEWSGMAMPWSYRTSLAQEQRAVREHVGLADLSQLRVLRVFGPDAGDCLEALVPRPIHDMPVASTRFCVVLSQFGRIFDETLVMRLTQDEFWLSHGCGGARSSLAKLASGRRVVIEALEDTHVLSVQGPATFELLSPLSTTAPDEIPPLGHRRTTIAHRPVLLSRTGFTGELGFELFCGREDVVPLWHALRDAGAGLGLVCCGYRCVDLLRIEAGFTLYPTDLGLCGSIWEAGLGWMVRGKGAQFVGRAAVFEAKGKAEYRFAGARCGQQAPLPPRTVVARAGRVIGSVTSSAYSPGAGATLAIVRIRRDAFEDGAEIVFRADAEIPAHLCGLPFRERRTQGRSPGP